MKKLLIAIVTLATLTLTGCNERRENVNINDIINSTVNSTSSTKTEKPAETSSTVEETSKVEESTSTSSEPSDPSFEVATPSSSSTTSKVEEPTSSSSKVESKPTETSSTTSSQKPATPSSSSSTSQKPSSSSTTTSSSKPAEKPVEQPTHTHTFTKATCTTPATCTGCGVTQGTTTDHNFKNGNCTTCGKADPNYVAPHDCRTDGHVWEVTYRTTEPKWCVERHDVTDFGFVTTLGDYNKFIENLAAMGIPGDSGASLLNIQVWGTETYEVKTCTKCGNTIGAGTRISINPMGDWEFIPGTKSRPGYEAFTTLFYDADNIPAEVIENIKAFWAAQGFTPWA